MLKAKSDSSSNCVRSAKQVFRTAIKKPLLVRQCLGVAAAWWA